MNSSGARISEMGRGPVLKRVLEEARAGHDKPTFIPRAHDDVGEGDLFDASPFSLHHHHESEQSRRLREHRSRPGAERHPVAKNDDEKTAAYKKIAEVIKRFPRFLSVTLEQGRRSRSANT